MSKLIKIMLSVALCIVAIFVFVACVETKQSYGDYHDGYVDGYADGTNEATHQISGYLEGRFNDVGNDNDIEEAIQVLTNYADGEPISEHELQEAIWSIRNFYYDTCDIVFDIDDYVVD